MIMLLRLFRLLWEGKGEGVGGGGEGEGEEGGGGAEGRERGGERGRGKGGGGGEEGKISPPAPEKPEIVALPVSDCNGHCTRQGSHA